jgi:hypothetical protein
MSNEWKRVGQFEVFAWRRAFPKCHFGDSDTGNTMIRLKAESAGHVEVR